MMLDFGEGRSCLCTSEASAGLIYDNHMKHWRGEILNLDRKFVVALKYGDRKIVDWFIIGAGVVEVNITPFGNSNSARCLALAGYLGTIPLPWTSALTVMLVLTPSTIGSLSV
jgi:hypothetical protein